MSRSKNPYDTMMKKLPQLLLAFVGLTFDEKYKLDFHRFLELSTEFNEILKRYTDTLLFVYGKSEKLKFLIHAEFQSVADPLMPQRMQIYYTLAEMKYQMPPVQYCINLYKVKSKEIQTIKKVRQKKYRFEYTEINVCNMNPDDFKHHPDLGIAMGSVLMNIPIENRESLVEFLLQRIVKSELSDKQKSDYLLEIDYLCGLRKELVPIFEQKVKNMSLHINIEETVIFGLGKKKGITEGEKKGEKKAKFEMAKELWKNSVPLDVIKKSIKLSNADWQLFLESIGQKEK